MELPFNRKIEESGCRVFILFLTSASCFFVFIACVSQLVSDYRKNPLVLLDCLSSGDCSNEALVRMMMLGVLATCAISSFVTMAALVVYTPTSVVTGFLREVSFFKPQEMYLLFKHGLTIFEEHPKLLADISKVYTKLLIANTCSKDVASIIVGQVDHLDNIFGPANRLEEFDTEIWSQFAAKKR